MIITNDLIVEGLVALTKQLKGEIKECDKQAQVLTNEIDYLMVVICELDMAEQLKERITRVGQRAGTVSISDSTAERWVEYLEEQLEEAQNHARWLAKKLEAEARGGAAK